MKAKLFALLFISSLTFPAIAQDLVIENVSTKMRKFRGVGDMEGKGHSLFIVDEKSSKGMKLFKFYMWDYQLNEIANTKIELEKKSYLIDETANDNNSLVVFYNKKTNDVRLLSIDSDGETVANVTADGMKLKYLMSTEDMEPSYYPSGNDGFLGIVPDKEPKFGYHLTRYDNNLNTIWSSDYFPTKGYSVVMDAISDENKLVVLKYGAQSKMSKRYDVDITAFDNKTGEEIWTYDLNLGDKTLYPTEITITDNGNIAVAGMYFMGDKVKGPNSDGIFFVHIGSEGNEIANTVESWDGQIQQFLKDAKNSMTMGKPKVVFEDILYDEVKKEFKVIGEIYTMGTFGKVMSMLSNDPNQETKVTIEDLVVFSFKDDGELYDFYAVNKTRTHIYLQTGLAGGPKISQLLKQTGSLPYAFSGKDQDGNVIAYYKDYVKLNEDGTLTNQKMNGLIGSQKLGIGMLNVSTSSAQNTDLKYLPFSKKAANKDEETDVEFDSKRSILIVSESEPGYVIVSELSKKTGDLRIFKQSIDN